MVTGLVAGIARGVDAGGTVEGIDFQPGIVGNGRQASKLRGVARFQQRVLDIHGTRRRPLHNVSPGHKRVQAGIDRKAGLRDSGAGPC